MRPYILNWIKQNGGAQPTPPNLEEKSVTITENGTTNVAPDTGYDGLNNVEITVNVGSSSKPVLPDIVSCKGSSATNMNWLAEVDTSNLISCHEMFRLCTNLESVPLFNTSKVEYGMHGMFQTCNKLEDVPVFNTSICKDMGAMFTSCPKLSNESLNNILLMCINSQESIKNLARIGLSSAQATTCQSLSNWDAFVAAGWSTGY